MTRPGVRRPPRTILTEVRMRPLSVIALLAGATLAAPQGWHRTKKEGKAAALKSGKPVLVVTIWKEEV